MRPPPFAPEPHPAGPAFIRDRIGGQVWHRVFHRVLYADTDRSGVVYHANYLRFFELGRASLMRDLGYPYAEVEARGFVYPIVDLALHFVTPLRYDEGMWVHTRPAELERVRVRFEYLITGAQASGQADDRILCRGHTRHCALGQHGTVCRVDPLTVQLWQVFPRGT